MWVGRTFFVWISVFNLFVVSVFWSFMTDIFRERQSRRLFGLIGVGGTVGGIVGSSITAFLVGFLSPATLLLFSVVLLEGAVLCLKALDARCAGGTAPGSRSDEAERVIGGSALEGIQRVLASPYLLGIGAFMLLFTIGSTFLYNIQADIISRTFTTAAERTLGLRAHRPLREPAHPLHATVPDGTAPEVVRRPADHSGSCPPSASSASSRWGWRRCSPCSSSSR